LPGDANGDELVNVIDFLLIVDFILERDPQPFFFGCGDVTLDGEINVLDIIAILHFILDVE
jgi:hypothetical protein